MDLGATAFWYAVFSRGFPSLGLCLLLQNRPYRDFYPQEHIQVMDIVSSMCLIYENSSIKVNGLLSSVQLFLCVWADKLRHEVKFTPVQSFNLPNQNHIQSTNIYWFPRSQPVCRQCSRHWEYSPRQRLCPHGQVYVPVLGEESYKIKKIFFFSVKR